MAAADASLDLSAGLVAPPQAQDGDDASLDLSAELIPRPQASQAATPQEIDYQHPAGAPGGTVPGIPRPQVDVERVPTFTDALTRNATENEVAPGVAPGISTIQNPSLVAHTLATVSGVPKVAQGARDIRAGHGERGLAEMLQGGTQAAMLAAGPAGAVEAPIETAVGLGAGYLGQRGAEKATKALGGSPDAQELAGTVGGLAAGAAGAAGIGSATGFLADRVGRPVAETAPSRVVDIRELPERPALTSGEPAHAQALQEIASGLVPRQLTAGGSALSAPTPEAPPVAHGPARTEFSQPIVLPPEPRSTPAGGAPARSRLIAGPDGSIQLQPAGQLPTSVEHYSIDTPQRTAGVQVLGRTAEGQPIIRVMPGENSPVPVIGGVQQRQLPRGPIQLGPGSEPVPAASGSPVSPEAQSTHPAGKVTGIDEATGLPIVDRTQPGRVGRSQPPEIPLVANGAALPPQRGIAGPMSSEAERVSAQAAAATNQGGKQEEPRENALKAPIGSPEPEMGRKVVQPTGNASEGQKLAMAAVPGMDLQPKTVNTAVEPADNVEALPPTNATHDFNLSRWKRANPQGDPIKAAKAAIRRGFKVVTGPTSLAPAEAASAADSEPAVEYRHGGFGAVAPAQLIPRPVRDYLAREAESIGKSREIHGGIYDLEPQHDADVLRANKLMQELPGTPADEEAAYHHLENPKVPVTQTQQAILDTLQPLQTQAEAIFRKLYPEKTQVENYVHRIAQQKGSLLDRILNGSQSTGKGNLLKKSAAAGKKRSMLALESPTGKRQVVSVSRGRVTSWHDNVPTDIGALRSGLTNPDEILDERLAPLEREETRLKNEERVLKATKSRQDSSSRRLENIAARLKEIEADKTAIEHEHTAESLPNKLWRDKDGNIWTFRQATTKEIEQHTPVSYFKNAGASTVTNWLELRKAERAYDFIEKIKNDPEFSHFGVKPKNPGQIPEGWKSTQLPQFMGYYFEPHVAEVFDHYAQQLRQGKPGVWEQIGDFLTTSIFLNPLSHIPNLTSNWLTEKGVSIANPLTWGREFKAGVKAFNAVVHQNQDFLEALDAGAPMRSQHRAVRQFAGLLIEKLQKEAQEPGTAEKIAEALGKVVNVPAALKTMVNFMADKSTWPVHDMYFLQSAYRKMGQGMSLKAALEDTAKYIPDERLPARILDSKAIADVMANPALTMFSRYHYGVLKGYGQIFKNLAGVGFEEAGTNEKGEPVNAAGRTKEQEQYRALSIAGALALMLAIVYPALDEIAAKGTGNKDARVRRAGYANFADALRRAIEGDITPLQAGRSVVTPAVLGETAVDLAANRDVFGTGRKIYDPHAGKGVIAQQVGERLAESVSPAQLAMRASESPESTRRVLYSLIGVSFPRHGALKLAAELNADRIPEEPETPEQRKKSILRGQARYLAWQGDQSGLEEARKSGLFSPGEMAELNREAKENPLRFETRDMPLADVLKVWRAATPEEKKVLLPVLVRKGQHLNAKSGAERNALRKRLAHAIAETRQHAPQAFR